MKNKNQCIYMWTSGQDVMCEFFDEPLGDIMGYDGKACENCEMYMKRGSLHERIKSIRQPI